MERQIYYAIMNILDGIALSEKTINMVKLNYILDDLLTLTDCDIEDIADANDCGPCTTWEEIIKSLKEQFANGDRVKVG